jgi:hypothetical protein
MSCLIYILMASCVISGFPRYGLGLPVGPQRVGILPEDGDRVQSPKRRFK